jgi:flagellar hook-associated protein 2
MATSSITTTGPLFQAGGLASGLDTNSIVDKIIAAESAPMLQIQKNQAAFSVQISTVANLTTKLKAFHAASDALATTGLAPIVPDSTYADFTIAGQVSNEGNNTIQVESMARAAKMRSKNFTSAQDASATGLTGNLQFSIDGVNSAAIDVTGKSLADIAEAINANVSQVTASVISTGTGYRLSVIRNTTGFAFKAEGAAPDDALKIITDPGLDLATIQPAQNAVLTIDGLEITRQTNTITNAIPGLTLNLKGESNVATEVNFVRDTSTATANIQSFITAYNDVVTLLNTQLRPDPNSASTNNAMGGSALLGIQRDMHNLLTQKVNTSGTVQMLSDLNVSLQDDGTLALDQVAFQKTFADAVNADPQGANLIFTKAATGIGAQVDAIAKRQFETSTVLMPNGKRIAVEGALVAETKLLTDSIASLDNTVDYWKVYLESERTRLTSAFTAMEAVISKLNTMSTYLDSIFNYNSSSSSSSSSK